VTFVLCAIVACDVAQYAAVAPRREWRVCSAPGRKAFQGVIRLATCSFAQ
jgi:hypothetical protein